MVLLHPFGDLLFIYIYIYIYIYINSVSYECNIAARKTLIYLEEYACKQIPLVLCSYSSDISGLALVFLLDSRSRLNTR